MSTKVIRACDRCEKSEEIDPQRASELDVRETLIQAKAEVAISVIYAKLDLCLACRANLRTAVAAFLCVDLESGNAG